MLRSNEDTTNVESRSNVQQDTALMQYNPNPPRRLMRDLHRNSGLFSHQEHLPQTDRSSLQSHQNRLQHLKSLSSLNPTTHQSQSIPISQRFKRNRYARNTNYNTYVNSSNQSKHEHNLRTNQVRRYSPELTQEELDLYLNAKEVTDQRDGRDTVGL